MTRHHIASFRTPVTRTRSVNPNERRPTAVSVGAFFCTVFCALIMLIKPALAAELREPLVGKDMVEALQIVSQSQALAASFNPTSDAQAQDPQPTPEAARTGAALSQIVTALGAEASAGSANPLPARVAKAQSAGVKRVAASTSAKRLASRVKPARQRFQGSAAPTFDQHRALGQLAMRLGQPVSAHLSAAGTPREISVRKTAAPAAQTLALQQSSGDSLNTARAFLISNAGLLRLDDPKSELRPGKESTDALGRTHLRFQQFYKGVEVWKSGLTVHLDANGSVDLVNGSFVPSPRKSAKVPLVTEGVAARLALAHVGAPATVYGVPKQIVYAGDSGNARLGWELLVQRGSIEHWVVIIDAINGSVLNAYNEAMSAAAVGAGVDLFGVNRDLNVWQQNTGFHMVDTSKQMFDASSSPPSASTTRGGIVILDAANQPRDPQQEAIPGNDVTSGSSTSGWLRDAVSASWGFSQTYDYFLERHGRNGLDNRGTTILATVRVGQNFNNAFFVPGKQAMFFGDAFPYAGALDVVGHELSHGVVATTSNLVYQDQSGALNESFADILGTAVQARSNGQVDWILGDQVNSPSLQRNLRDPNAQPSPLGGVYPKKMSQFVRTTADNGGVHINSSINNHAFYLYAEGLPGAVGLIDAEKVFYRAVTVHLTQRSQFVDARLAVVRSAEELFGAGSNQVLKAKEAYDRVEIFETPSAPGPTPFPGVDGPDSTIAVGFDSSTFETVLVRREQAAGDPQFGSRLSVFDLAVGRRPAVSGNGEFVVFVDSVNDLCLMPTNGSAVESCLGFPGTVHAVSMTPDGSLVSFILLDQFGNPDNLINVTNVVSGQTQSFELLSPALDGVAINSVANADAMDFSSDGRLLIYDALNVIGLSDGSQIGLWSIFALDLVSGRTLALIPPRSGIDIGFPTISQASDRYFTFDAFDQQSGQSTVVAVDLQTGQGQSIAVIGSGFGVPGYTGDDSAIVYSQFDPSVPTQFTLLRQPLAEDRITPVGSPEVWLQDADFGVIYRRGEFRGAPDVNLVLSLQADAQSISLGESFNYRVDIENQGRDTSNDVVLTDTIPDDVTLGSISASQGSCQISGKQVTCNLGTIAGGASVTLVVPVTPMVSGTITVASSVVSAEQDKDVDNNASISSVTVVTASTAASRPASAVLPGSRSVQTGALATAFATLLNTDSVPIEGCSIVPLTELAASFFYQTSDPATNALTGTPNTPVTVAANSAQTFVVGLTPTAAFAPTDVEFAFDCGNTEPATVISGVNTLLLSASDTPVADVVALGATPSADGILNVPVNTGAAAFAVASVNVGAAASITVTAVTTNEALPLVLNVCETNPGNGQCLGSPASSVTTTIAGGATPTFSVFASGMGPIGFNPAGNRISVVFEDSGTVRGATSVAVRTQ